MPAFSGSQLFYSTTTTTAVHAITAVATDPAADITILNGATPVTNGGNATFVNGVNTVTVEVEIVGVEVAVYTIQVTATIA